MHSSLRVLSGRAVRLLGGLAGLWILAACGLTPQLPSAPAPGSGLLTPAASGPTATPTPESTPTPSVASVTPSQSRSATAPPSGVSKVLVFVVENHSFDQMKAQMPYTYGLAKQFAYATNMTAARHPSLPNYIAMASGSTQGITDDQEPARHPIQTPSVFGAAIAAGRTAGVYADGMTDNCAVHNGGDRYVARHNPWTYFPSERSDCAKYDQPFARFDQDVSQGSLPDIGLAIPNNCHNAHDDDCDLGIADQWFKSQLTKVLAGPDYRSGRLAVVLTADEDDRHSDNHVLTVVIHPSQSADVVDQPLTHYSLCRLFSEVTHTTPLAEAQAAPSMAEAFRLPIAAG
jgi:hypothetical protein